MCQVYDGANAGIAGRVPYPAARNFTGGLRWRLMMQKYSPLVALAFVVLITAGCSEGRASLDEAYIRDDERVLEVIVSTCQADLTTDVEETPSQVVITVTAKNDNANLDCQDPVLITLSEPLGDRTLIDGSTDRAVDVIRLGPPAQ